MKLRLSMIQFDYDCRGEVSESNRHETVAAETCFADGSAFSYVRRSTPRSEVNGQ